MQYNNALITITKDATADPYVLYHQNKFYMVGSLNPVKFSMA